MSIISPPGKVREQPHGRQWRLEEGVNW